MKKSIIFCILISTNAIAQSKVLESLKLKSATLQKEVELSIYLPKSYENSTRKYPVLYLLHGYSDDETGWTQFGQIQEIADKTINSGEAPEMIIVTPDAGVSWYLNSFDVKVRYEDFFVQELIKYIDENYRTRSKKEFRAIAGLSMGGHGALVLAMKYPNLFSAACPLSAAIFTDEDVETNERWELFFGDIFGKNLIGKDRLTDYYKKNSALHIVQNIASEDKKKVRFYIDCGDDDFLIKGNMALHSLMITKNIPHEFRVREGGHTWSYWRGAMPEVLKFVGQSFTR